MIVYMLKGAWNLQKKCDIRFCHRWAVMIPKSQLDGCSSDDLVQLISMTKQLKSPNY